MDLFGAGSPRTAYVVDRHSKRSMDGWHSRASRSTLNQSVVEEAFGAFVENVFLPMKRGFGKWGQNTEKESSREIRRHPLPELGDVPFEEMTPALLSALLKKNATEGLRRQTLNHLEDYLTDICKCT